MVHHGTICGVQFLQLELIITVSIPKIIPNRFNT
jgi:hypothetical protein